MNFMKKGCGVLAALLPLALVGPAMAEMGGNVQTRYIVNDIDKISRDQPAGDNAVNKKKMEAFGYFSHSDYPGWFGGFYVAREINYRQEYGYPPLRRMARLVYWEKNPVKAEAEAENMAAMIRIRIFARTSFRSVLRCITW